MSPTFLFQLLHLEKNANYRSHVRTCNVSAYTGWEGGEEGGREGEISSIMLGSNLEDIINHFMSPCSLIWARLSTFHQDCIIFRAFTLNKVYPPSVYSSFYSDQHKALYFHVIFGCQTQKTNQGKRFFFSRSSIKRIYRREKQKLKRSLKITVVHPKSNGESCWRVSCSASIRVQMMEQTKVRNKQGAFWLVDVP